MSSGRTWSLSQYWTLLEIDPPTGPDLYSKLFPQLLLKMLAKMIFILRLNTVQNWYWALFKIDLSINTNIWLKVISLLKPSSIWNSSLKWCWGLFEIYSLIDTDIWSKVTLLLWMSSIRNCSLNWYWALFEIVPSTGTDIWSEVIPHFRLSSVLNWSLNWYWALFKIDRPVVTDISLNAMTLLRLLFTQKSSKPISPLISSSPNDISALGKRERVCLAIINVWQFRSSLGAPYLLPCS